MSDLQRYQVGLGMFSGGMGGQIFRRLFPIEVVDYAVNVIRTMVAEIVKIGMIA